MATFTGSFDGDKSNGASQACMPIDWRRARAALVACAVLGLGCFILAREASSQSVHDHPSEAFESWEAWDGLQTVAGDSNNDRRTDVGPAGAIVSGPVAAVGHGALLDADGNEIEPSRQFIIEAQRYYIDALYQRANQNQQLAFDEKNQRLLAAGVWRRSDEVHANAALIAWLIDKVGPVNRSTLHSINAVLLERFAGPTSGRLPGRRAFVPSRAMLQNLRARPKRG